MPRYKKLMIQRGVMQKAVAEKVHKTDPRVDTSLMSKFVNGVCLPTPHTLATICKTLACDPLDIYDRDEITLAPPPTIKIEGLDAKMSPAELAAAINHDVRLFMAKCGQPRTDGGSGKETRTSPRKRLVQSYGRNTPRRCRARICARSVAKTRLFK